MKKSIVAAIALVLAGTAAFAAVRIGVYGVCPLTGKPIHRGAFACPSTTECPFEDQRCIERGASAIASPAVAAQDTAATRSHCCCPKKRECAEAKQVEPEAPPAEPASRP